MTRVGSRWALIFLFAWILILHSPFFIHHSCASTVQLPETGQTTSYAAGDDGNLERGVAWPAQRFNNNGNGTVTDNLTGLIWLRDANCTDSSGGITKSNGYLTWQNALTWSNNLSSGRCGLSDGSSVGQWRLPNVDELESLVDLERYNPALPTGHPFNNVQANGYWSSSTYAFSTYGAWLVSMNVGYVYGYDKTSSYYVWPVRSGQVGYSVSSAISFSNITAQSLPASFPVTLTAVNAAGAGINGSVNLYMASGARIYPTSVSLVNGNWSGDITVYSPEIGASIIAQGPGGVSGTSNMFNVADLNQPNPQGYVTGKVSSMDFSQPVANATIVVSGVSPTTNSTTATSNLYGRYQLTLPLGIYTFRAVAGANTGMAEKITVRDGVTNTVDLLVNAGGKPPVLVIPGMMGSTDNNKSDNVLYPWMPAGKVLSGSQLKVLNPKHPISRKQSIVRLKELKEALAANFRVFEVPWDWRMDTDEAVDIFLMPAIKNALEATGGAYQKVDIVAHSQGGLLTRAYIQGSKFRQDIDRFIMVGTPNQGSANPYWLLEGGDPKAIDDLTEGILDAGANFYSHVANNLYKAETGGNAFKTCAELYWWDSNSLLRCELGSPNEGLDFNFRKNLSQANMKKFLNKTVPGGRNLMASYLPFVSDEKRGVDFNAELNPWLRDLNLDSTGMNRMVYLNDLTSPAEKVRTALLLSTGEKTLRIVNVDSHKTDIYPYGDPRSSQTQAAIGDGTVPANEARQPLLGKIESPAAEERGPHAGLLGDYKAKIKDYLCAVPRSCASSSAKVVAMSVASVPEVTLSASLTGRVQPFLVAPNGTNGVDPQTNAFSETIPNSSTVLSGSGALVEITSPADGSYTLSIKGQFDDIYDLSFNYSDGTVTETKQLRGVHHNGDIMVTFSIAAGAATKLTVDTPVPSPVGLTAADNAGSTVLSWQAVTDPSVAAYDVYAKRHDQPSFSLLGSTAPPVVTLATGHPWGLAEQWTYLVIARRANGSESFFSDMTENYIQLVAGFSADITSGVAPLTVSFTDASRGTATGWQWDLDGDSETDSTIGNPTFTYTIPGTYAVSLTVTGPDGSDHQVRNGYIIVTGALVNGSCGSSNGGMFTTAPSTNLCSAGTASAVSGTGPWTWECMGLNGSSANCSTAIFNEFRYVKLFGLESYFATISQAYAGTHAGTKVIFQLTGQVLNGNVSFDKNVAVSLKGGFDAGFSKNTGMTAIKGVLIVRNGSVRVENLIVR